MSLPHGAMGWSSVCDCVITCSYSLTFLIQKALDGQLHISRGPTLFPNNILFLSLGHFCLICSKQYRP